MKESLLLLFISFGLLYFSKENIIFNKDSICPFNINDTLPDISINEKKFYENSEYYENYGFNAQNCRIKKITSDNKANPSITCCYINLLFNNNLYNFCAEVYSEDCKNNFIERVINNLKQDDWNDKSENEKEEIKNKLKEGLSIDCFSIKLKLFKIFIFIPLILII